MGRAGRPRATGGGGGTRERLLAAAADLFARRGYADTPVREICRQAGVSKPALYYYFGSKAGLINALLAETADRFLDEMRRIAQEPGSVRDRLRAIARGVFRQSGAAPDAGRFFYACLFAPSRAGGEHDSGRIVPELFQLTKGIFEEGQRRREVSAEYEPEFCAMVLLGALQGYTIRFLRRSDVMLTPELAEKLNLDETEGVVITEVDPRSAAGREGLREGMVITQVEKQPVTAASEFAQRAQAALKEHGSVLLRVSVDNRSLFMILEPRESD